MFRFDGDSHRGLSFDRKITGGSLPARANAEWRTAVVAFFAILVFRSLAYANLAGNRRRRTKDVLTRLRQKEKNVNDDDEGCRPHLG